MNKERLFETLLQGTILSEKKLPMDKYEYTIIDTPLKVFLVRDCGAADDEREVEIRIEDQQTIKSAIQRINRATQGVDFDYIVVEDEGADMAGSIPFTNLLEVENYILQHYTYES